MNELELNWGLKNQARCTSSKNHQAATTCGFKDFQNCCYVGISSHKQAISKLTPQKRSHCTNLLTCSLQRLVR